MFSKHYNGFILSVYLLSVALQTYKLKMCLLCYIQYIKQMLQTIIVWKQYVVKSFNISLHIKNIGLDVYVFKEGGPSQKVNLGVPGIIAFL